MKPQEVALVEHAPIQAQTKEEIRRTVKAGHYVVLAAITSKFIWAPERGNKKSQERKRRERRESSEFTPELSKRPTTRITGVVKRGVRGRAPRDPYVAPT